MINNINKNITPHNSKKGGRPKQDSKISSLSKKEGARSFSLSVKRLRCGKTLKNIQISPLEK